MSLLFCCAQLIATAQQQPALTMPQAVQQALDRYPAVRSSIEQVRAAAAGINLARTSYLPRADFLGEVNRATHNNVFGQLFPQSVIPSMTGPVLGTNSAQSVWGSAVGALVSWEPIDFGLRCATVDGLAITRSLSSYVSGAKELPFNSRKQYDTHWTFKSVQFPEEKRYEV